MRIAIVAANRRIVGGAEVYLDVVVPALAAAGNEIALLTEHDLGAARPPIALDPSAPSWDLGALGEREAIAALEQWRPDVIYTHGLRNPRLEGRILAVAPPVTFAHNYYGTCISGLKMWRR